MKQATHYALHRWLGGLIGLQLLLWSTGGLIFATHDIDEVRGQEGRNEAEPTPIPMDRVRLSPAQARDRAELENPTSLELRLLLDEPVYAVRAGEQTRLVDARTGALRSPLGKQAAVAIARADRAGAPESTHASLVTEDPEIEYRGRPLPAWRVELDDGQGTHIYVAADTGLITARRNDAWRRFDFFWMLHTMDYGARDDFNTPLLIVAASLAILLILSGGILWALRLRRRRERLRAPPGA